MLGLERVALYPPITCKNIKSEEESSSVCTIKPGAMGYLGGMGRAYSVKMSLVSLMTTLFMINILSLMMSRLRRVSGDLIDLSLSVFFLFVVQQRFSYNEGNVRECRKSLQPRNWCSCSG